MVGNKYTFNIPKKATEVAQKKEQWLAHDEFLP